MKNLKTTTKKGKLFWHMIFPWHLEFSLKNHICKDIF